jgi:hypothetical protein
MGVISLLIIEAIGCSLLFITFGSQFKKDCAFNLSSKLEAISYIADRDALVGLLETHFLHNGNA